MKILKRCEDFFWLLLFINPFFDLINGFYLSLFQSQYGEKYYLVANFGITPTLVIRMLILVMFGLYLLFVKHKLAILTLVGIGVAWALSVLMEFRNGTMSSIFADMQYIARYAYNIVVIFVFLRLSNETGRSPKEVIDKLNKVISFTLIVFSASILLAYISGVGFYTYADRFGYRGSRGFFFSGNDITAIFMMLLPVPTFRFISGAYEAPTTSSRSTSPPRYAWIKTLVLPSLPIAFTCNALFIIGTKTAFLSAGVTLIAALIYSIVVLVTGKTGFADKSITTVDAEASGGKASGYLKRLGILVLSIVLVLFILVCIKGLAVLLMIWESLFNSFIIYNMEGIEMALLSGRQVKLRETFDIYKSSGLLSLIFGIGRGSVEYVVEMDLFEVLFYYGVFGAICLLWFYAVTGLRFVGNFFKKITPVSIGVLCSLVLSVGYLTVAGHVLFSVTSGFYFALMLVYGTVMFNHKPYNKK